MDLCATPAVELARLIRARELSAAELLSAVLALIIGEPGIGKTRLLLAAGNAPGIAQLTSRP